MLPTMKEAPFGPLQPLLLLPEHLMLRHRSFHTDPIGAIQCKQFLVVGSEIVRDSRHVAEAAKGATRQRRAQYNRAILPEAAEPAEVVDPETTKKSIGRNSRLSLMPIPPRNMGLTMGCQQVLSQVGERVAAS